MSDAIELKPCPCGSQAHASEIIGGWMINCLTPQCAFEAVRDTSDEAVLAWNARPIEDALRARIAELEVTVSDLRRAMRLLGANPYAKSVIISTD
jgi:hypothetical protein